MAKCPDCLTTDVGWKNPVPMCELTGEREEDPEFCPHCGANCHPWFGPSSFYLNATKLPADSKFKVAGTGAFFSEEV